VTTSSSKSSPSSSPSKAAMPSSVASSSGDSPKRRPLMATAADVVIAATQQPHLIAATNASFAPNAVNSESGPLTPISLIFDSLTFDKRQTRWLKDMERSVRRQTHKVIVNCVIAIYISDLSRVNRNVHFIVSLVPIGRLD